MLDLLGSSETGLTAAAAAERLSRFGPNAIVSHRARLWPVLWHQLKSPLLGLLAIAAIASYFVGERSDAVIIGVILALSVGMGFLNEYRAEKAAEALHSQIRHRAVVLRDGQPASVDVTELVPGDVVELSLGDVIPADMRLLASAGLECDESILTGESMPAEKEPDAVPAGTALADLTDCALMGTVVRAGSGRGVVVATGAQAEFGRIAVGLGAHQMETEFQAGLRRFSVLLVEVAITLTTSIFIINVLLHKPIINALLFSLAIAVGITPQLLPAVVSTSLAAGSRQMARRKVLVKRLVCIEDLGDVDVLFTDKTGTLTQGRISFMRGVDFDAPGTTLRWGLVCNEVAVSGGQAVGGNQLDVALWESPAAIADRAAVAALPPRRVAALRPRAADGVGARGRARRRPGADHQGRPRGGAEPLRRGSRARPRRPWRRSSRPATGSSPWPRRPADGLTALTRRRRARPAPGRTARLPRRPQAQRRPGAGPARQPGSRGQDRHRR